MADDIESYKHILTRLITKQAALLGLEVALSAARKIPGLVVGDDGRVVSIKADAKTVSEKVAEAYVFLSGQQTGGLSV